MGVMQQLRSKKVHKVPQMYFSSGKIFLAMEHLESQGLIEMFIQQKAENNKLMCKLKEEGEADKRTLQKNTAKRVKEWCKNKRKAEDRKGKEVAVQIKKLRDLTSKVRNVRMETSSGGSRKLNTKTRGLGKRTAMKRMRNSKVKDFLHH